MGIINDHFKPNLNNKLSNPKAIFKGVKYRITILSEMLVRLEYDEAGIFFDELTEQISNRNFPVPKFKVQEDENDLIITTDNFTIQYLKERPFLGTRFTPDSNLRINVSGSDKYWFFGSDEPGNITVFKTNLDTKKDYKSISERIIEENENTKKKKLKKLDLDLQLNKAKRKSLYSTDGFASIDDSKSLVIDENGYLVKPTRARIDTYVFIYRDNFRECLKEYFMLTGTPPLLPRYALGIWWYKETGYSFEDIRRLLFDFNKYGIPLNVLLLGQQWHLKDQNDLTKFKTGFSFNKGKLGTPTNLTTYLHDRGVRLALNIDPCEGIFPHEERYKDFSQSLNIADNQTIPFNAFDKNLVASYLEHLITPLYNDGIDFFWIDYKTKDLETLTALNYYHFNDYKRFTDKRGIVLSRISGSAPHKYSIKYSGETTISWDTLRKIPKYTSNSSNINVALISHDIGGFKDGIEDAELYLRYIQLGCFQPILRLASDASNYYKREPWRWDVKTSQIVKEYLILRNRLIGYLYSEYYKYYKLGVPVFEPLYYNDKEIMDEPDYSNEYYFGSELLIAPITNQKDNVMQRVVHKVYLPEGTWYDFKTGKKYIGDKRYVLFYKDEDYPVFAKSGSIICLGDLSKNLNVTNPPKSMEIHIFPGRSNIYNVYEDDGVSNLYEQGYYIITRFDYNYLQNNYTLIIRPYEGKSGIIPETRDYKIRFRNTRNADSVQVMLEANPYHYEAYVEDNDFIVEVKDVSTIKQLTIICQGKDIEIDSTRLITEDIDSILNDLPLKTELKDEIASIIYSRKDTSEKRIALKHLRKKGLNYLFLKMFEKLLEYSNNNSKEN